ncbi:MAG: hypothetical protein K0M64_06395 [Rhizobium sp.]|nr:hypothetical protein [Rhizobium sp.]
MSTSAQLLEILESALDATGDKLTPHVKNRPKRIPEWRADLMAHFLDPPFRVLAIPKAHARSCKVAINSLEAWALVRKDLGWNHSWLLYDPADQQFWLAWGKDPEGLELTGFSGGDPLDVWLN